MAAPVIVHRPSRTGGRRVTVRGEILGLAHNERDLWGFLLRAGIEGAEMQLEEPKFIEWRGGGPGTWD